MFKSVFRGLIIIALGLAFLSGFSAWVKKGNQKHSLAEWTQSETGNWPSPYVVEQVKIDDFDIRIDEIMGLGQARIGSDYALIAQRGISSHGDSLYWMCRGSGYGWAMYAYKADPNKFLAFNFGDKPSLKGCRPGVSSAVFVEFPKDGHA